MEITKKQTFSETFKVYFDRRMMKILLLGAKVVFLQSLEVFKSLAERRWIEQKHNRLGWVNFAVYAFNYLWAPIIDRVRSLVDEKVGHVVGLCSCKL